MTCRTAFCFVLLALPATAQELPDRVASAASIEQDLQVILREAKLSPASIAFKSQIHAGGTNRVQIACQPGGAITLQVSAQGPEWGSTFYYGLQKLGFLFPHPRMQISPTKDRMLRACGLTFEWRPRLRYRGFHLHTEHPNEWVLAFMGRDKEIAEDTIRWLARNGQNVIEFSLLRTSPPDLWPDLDHLIQYAHRLGIDFGIAVTFTQFQQKHYLLIPPLRALTGIGDDSILRTRLAALAQHLPFDFLTVNLGTTEFTSTPFKRTLEWIETAHQVLTGLHRQLFITVHVSTGQTDPEYGNFNFLPIFSARDVGIFVHTVMFYGLCDASAPVYGRQDFSDIDGMMISERNRRPIWYFPETSYFIGMDIDVPLLLTDYLVARSADMDHITSRGITGQITFTSGQELGYWLMDWTVALLANRDYQGRPMIGLELLGEDPSVWEAILQFQTRYFKKEQLIAAISATTPLDELAPVWGKTIHERVLLRQLTGRSGELTDEVHRLHAAVAALPPLDGVRNHELRTVLQVTWNRVRHAYYLRAALQAGVRSAAGRQMLRQAAQIRAESADLMAEIESCCQRYPEAHLFERQQNPTSYDFGYAWPARTLHYWEREELIVRDRIWNPFFMSIYNVWTILM